MKVVVVLGLILIGAPHVTPTDLTTYSICDGNPLNATEGYIVGPDLTSSIHENVNCSFEIRGNSSEVITIRFEELSIEGNPDEQHPNRVTVCGALWDRNVSAPSPCCLGAMLQISELEPREERYHPRTNKIQHTFYCNKGPVPQPFLSYGNGVRLQFISNGNLVPKDRDLNRRFRLRFLISKTGFPCAPSEFTCESDKKCLPLGWRCNRIRECSDSSDEKHCDHPSYQSVFRHTPPRNTKRPIHLETLPIHLMRPPRPKTPCGDKQHFPCGTADATECYQAKQRCDHVKDCSNGFDEFRCGSVKYTHCLESRSPGNSSPCSEDGVYCYDAATQRCDGTFNCPRGEDERGCNASCPGLIPCGMTCGFRLDQRCDGFEHCHDGSDEENCISALCIAREGRFLCNDGRCISEGRRCDHIPDCSGGEDELYCIKNSVITAAIMGSLVCGILVVIAISCVCRLYAMRPGSAYQRQQNCLSSHSQEDRLRRPSSISDSDQLRFDALQDLYCYYGFRDPPPPYNVAVGGEPPAIPPPPLSSGRRRRSRLHHQRPHTRRNSTGNGPSAPTESSLVTEASTEEPQQTSSLESPPIPQLPSPKPSTSSQDQSGENVAAEERLVRTTYEQLVKGSDDSSEMSSRISDEIEFTVLPSSTSTTIAVGAEASSPTSDVKPLISE